MSDIVVTGTSGYSVGAIDTASTLVNNVSLTDAKQPNGLAAAILQIETALGVATTLVGSHNDLVTRLAVALSSAGVLNANLAIPTPTITAPAITGAATIGNGCTLTTPVITSPSVTGTVGGAATYSSIVVTGNTLGTGALKTATGSATLSAVGDPATTVADIVMNDYSFFPSLTYDHNAITGNMNYLAGSNLADPNTTTGRFTATVFVDQGGGGARTITGTVRWRYITASDNPEMWVAYDPATGHIMSTWASDDPTPGGQPGVSIPGMVSLRLTAKELESFTLLTPKAQEAAEYIAEHQMKLCHQAYRALQLHTGDAAPSSWLSSQCQVNLTTGAIEVKGTAQA